MVETGKGNSSTHTVTTPGLDPGEKVDLIAEASELNVEIHNARPRWALGLTLNGQVAAARGELIAAIQSLKSGISNGDTRLSTAYLLTKLLLQTNRVVEAESEYSRFERLRQANSSVRLSPFPLRIKKETTRRDSIWPDKPPKQFAPMRIHGCC